MKRVLMIGAVMLMASSLTASSRGSSPGSAALGSAHTLSGGEMRTATFDAITHADGSVSGNAEINVHALGVAWHTSIECLTVVGNRAFLGGTVTESSDATRVRVGTKSYFWVEDNGEGNDAPPDRVSVAGVNETPTGLADFCGLVQNLLPGRDVLHGNVQVR
jgi:fermentation-respiration switch protein FrsA (DUF1100 family)